MFHPNQAALLCLLCSVHLVMSHVNTGRSPVDYRNILVSRGDSVTLTCNKSKESLTQIMWTKDRLYFAYSFLNDKNVSNFTSHRLIIDLHPLSVLNIFNVEYEDAGLYTCNVTSVNNVNTMRWNLTVTEKSEGISPLWNLTLVAVFILSGFILSVYIYRSRRQKQDLTQNQSNLRSDELPQRSCD